GLSRKLGSIQWFGTTSRAKGDTKSSQPNTASLTASSEVGWRHTNTMAVPVSCVSAADTHKSSNWKCCTVGQLKICPTVSLALFTISVTLIASCYGSNNMNAASFVRRRAFHHWTIRCRQRKRGRLGRQNLSFQRKTGYCARI